MPAGWTNSTIAGVCLHSKTSSSPVPSVTCSVCVSTAAHTTSKSLPCHITVTRKESWDYCICGKTCKETAQLSDLLSLPFGDTMSNPIGDDAQSARDEKDREGELLCLKIKAQLEDLLSDSHLAEDGFLLKHVLRNKQGYVSLKLLTCLRKIKVLTTDWHVTLGAALCSEILEVNDECTKVRRREPLPKWLLCSPTSKLLLAWNFPVEEAGEDGAPRGLEHPSLAERVLQKFSAHGCVTSLWILRPGKELPRELQCYPKHHKELSQHLCVVVKFDHLEEVRTAYNALKAEEEESNGEGMRVVCLGFQSMHRVTKDEPSEENNENQSGDTPFKENPAETSEESFQEEPSLPVKVSDETPDTSQPQKSSDNSMRRTSKQISTSCNNQPLSGLNQRYSKRSWCSGDCDKENSQSPWVLRRKNAAGAGHMHAPVLMQRVLRQPFGPDGTRGFRARVKLL